MSAHYGISNYGINNYTEEYCKDLYCPSPITESNRPVFPYSVFSTR